MFIQATSTTDKRPINLRSYLSTQTLHVVVYWDLMTGRLVGRQQYFGDLPPPSAGYSVIVCLCLDTAVTELWLCSAWHVCSVAMNVELRL
jgi:hypothetical protein